MIRDSVLSGMHQYRRKVKSAGRNQKSKSIDEGGEKIISVLLLLLHLCVLFNILYEAQK